MRIIRSLEEESKEPIVLALGNFDGIHLGHKALIKECVAKAEEIGIKPAVFTFSNHPKNIIANESFTKNIVYFDEKAKILKDLGVKILFSIVFDEKVMTMSPREFVEDILIKKLNMKYAFCGFNYNFGAKGGGNTDDLIMLGKEFGFNVQIIPPIIIDGNLVSSTLIRSLIEEGKVDECIKYLGRPYSVDGQVIAGNKMGKALGFPTSNLAIDEEMVSPANGVYVSRSTYEGVTYNSITNVGNKPTIGDYLRNVETHIFDFDKELYNKTIHVEFLQRIRDEIKFESKEELVKQIAKDCQYANKFFEDLMDNTSSV